MRRVVTVGWISLLGSSAIAGNVAVHVSPDLLHAAVADALGCPKQRASEEILVCGEREEDRRYRIGSAHVPEYGTRASQSTSRERHALLDYDAGGDGKCSSVGAWGAWGCMVKEWKADQEQAAGSKIKGGILYKSAY